MPQPLATNVARANTPKKRHHQHAVFYAQLALTIVPLLLLLAPSVPLGNTRQIVLQINAAYACKALIQTFHLLQAAYHA